MFKLKTAFLIFLLKYTMSVSVIRQQFSELVLANIIPIIITKKNIIRIITEYIYILNTFCRKLNISSLKLLI